MSTTRRDVQVALVGASFMTFIGCSIIQSFLYQPHYTNGDTSMGEGLYPFFAFIIGGPIMFVVTAVMLHLVVHKKMSYSKLEYPYIVMGVLSIAHTIIAFIFKLDVPHTMVLLMTYTPLVVLAVCMPWVFWRLLKSVSSPDGEPLMRTHSLPSEVTNALLIAQVLSQFTERDNGPLLQHIGSKVLARVGKRPMTREQIVKEIREEADRMLASGEGEV